MTGTLGKALGGALGGYIAGPQPVIDLLRQRARPYLFSMYYPAVVAAGIAAPDLVEAADDLRSRLFDNARYWRRARERRLHASARRTPDHSGHAWRRGLVATDGISSLSAAFMWPVSSSVVPKGQPVSVPDECASDTRRSGFCAGSIPRGRQVSGAI